MRYRSMGGTASSDQPFPALTLVLAALPPRTVALATCQPSRADFAADRAPSKILVCGRPVRSAVAATPLEARSKAWYSSPFRSISVAATFSSSWATLEAPGIATTAGSRMTQARAT